MYRFHRLVGFLHVLLAVEVACSAAAYAAEDVVVGHAAGGGYNTNSKCIQEVVGGP